MKKNYHHFGYTTRVDHAVTAIDGITWIETMLNNGDGILTLEK